LPALFPGLSHSSERIAAIGRLLPVDPLHSGHSGQITGFHRPGGVHGDAGERIISLFVAEKFYFLGTNFANCVSRHPVG
jgi:hypothetical protein